MTLRDEAERRLDDELLDRVKWVIASTDRHGYDQTRRFILDALDPVLRASAETWLKKRIACHRHQQALNAWPSGNDGLHDMHERQADALEAELTEFQAVPAGRERQE